MRASSFLPLALMTLSSLRCAGLSPGAVSAIEAVDAGLCTALSAVPTVGPVVALACQGEEAALAAALAVAAKTPAAGAGSSAVTSPALVRVHRVVNGQRKLVGFVSASHGAVVQAAVNGAS
jgi:hypothetical protein